MLSKISTIYLYLLYLLQGVGGQQRAGSVRDCVPAAVPLHVVVPPGAGLHQSRPHCAGQCAHVSKYFSSSEEFLVFRLRCCGLRGPGWWCWGWCSAARTRTSPPPSTRPPHSCRSVQCSPRVVSCCVLRIRASNEGSPG